MSQDEDTGGCEAPAEDATETRDPGVESAPPGERADVASPVDDLKKGLALLIKAARGAATTVKRGVDSPGTHDALRDARRELDRMAGSAIRGVGRLVARFQPQQAPRYEREVPPAERRRVPPGWRAPDDGGTNSDP